MSENRIPKTFVLKGHNWKVRSGKHLKDDDGETDQVDRVIYLRPGLKRSERWETFLHEFFHAVLFELHLVEPTRVINSDTEEILVTGLADVISSTFALHWREGKARGAKRGSKQPES